MISAGFSRRRVGARRCVYGEYPLSFCASMGRADLCGLLFDEMRRRLAARGGDAVASGVRSFLGAADGLGNTALHMAALNGRTEVVDWLMERGGGALLEAASRDGLTPLTLAVRHGKAEVYHHLLER